MAKPAQAGRCGLVNGVLVEQIIRSCYWPVMSTCGIQPPIQAHLGARNALHGGQLEAWPTLLKCQATVGALREAPLLQPLHQWRVGLLLLSNRSRNILNRDRRQIMGISHHLNDDKRRRAIRLFERRPEFANCVDLDALSAPGFG